MTPDNYPHYFKIQNKEPYYLPGEKFAPETGIACWDWRIGFVFISFYYVFLNHCFRVLGDRLLGCKEFHIDNDHLNLFRDKPPEGFGFSLVNKQIMQN